ncbi:MAG: hypothetical protein ABJP49_00040, partial [Marinobacter alexandrii]
SRKGSTARGGCSGDITTTGGAGIITGGIPGATVASSGCKYLACRSASHGTGTESLLVGGAASMIGLRSTSHVTSRECLGPGDLSCPPDPPPHPGTKTCAEPSTTCLLLASNSW